MLEPIKRFLKRARGFTGPVGEVAFWFLSPILFLVGMIWIMSTMVTMLILIPLAKISGDRLSDKASGFLVTAMPVGLTAWALYALADHHTKGFRNVNIPDILMGYFFYVGLLLAVIGVWLLIIYLGYKLCERYPILKVVAFAIIALAVIAGMSSNKVRDCEIEWGIRGSYCVP